MAVIGDSHMRRTHSFLTRQYLSNAFVTIQVRNYSRGGALAVSIDMSDLLIWAPDLVFIWIGSNDLDLVHEGPVSDHALKIRAIWNTCQDQGIHAYTIGLPNRYSCQRISPEVYNTRSDRVNHWLRRRSAGRHLELPECCYKHENYLADNVHLHNYCYRQVASLIRYKIMSVIRD